MAAPRRQKEALRLSLFAFIAGGHYVTEQVWKTQSLLPGSVNKEMLLADYARFCSSSESIDSLADILDEEDLYPYGNEWPREALMHLLGKLIVPAVSFEETRPHPRFRFKKGFKEMLTDFSCVIEGAKRDRSTLDHWLVLVVNGAFYAGAVCASRMAENTKVYFNAVQEVEQETEPWAKYDQISALL